MPSPKPNEASIFNIARKIESTADRDAYLAESCQGDAALRDRIDKLLVAFAAESQFLEQPAAGLEATMHLDRSIQDRESALEAGLAAAFTVDEAILLGDANHSVLKMLGQTLANVPRVALRESADEGADPITRPKSPEMPDRLSDSRYQLQGEIARGGMGAILKGRDTDLGRDLAIKVLLDTHKNKPEVVQRFIEEAQIGGQLQHPGIAPIYELGQFADKRPFFAMKLIKGKTLSVLLAERQELVADRAKFVGIFEQVCQTMAYVHSRGVIHRDLKPANIMVGAFGEVQVMDWGLAKVLKSGGTEDEKKSHQLQQGQSIVQTLRSVGSDVPGPFGSGGSGGSETQMGSVMGTPGYMPPEQALGEIDRLDERSDVFGLGAILSEILTGQPAYSANNGTEIFRLASRGKLADCFTRLDSSGADVELIKLAKHCLELEPKDRPRDAGVLAERISGYIASVETRLHKTELERAAQAARAIEERKLRRLTVASAAGVLLLISVGCGGWMWRVFDQAERRTATVAKINNALNEAQLHRSLADAADSSTPTQELADVAALGSRLQELEKAVVAAKRAVEYAEEGNITAEVRSSATSLLAELKERNASVAKLVEQTNRDRTLQKELDAIRLSQADGGTKINVVNSDRNFDFVSANNRYEQVFREAGLDLTVLETEQAVKLIQTSKIRESLIVAIDNWTRSIHSPSSLEKFVAATDIENWKLAANAGQELLHPAPSDSLKWLRVAPVLLLAEDDKAYREFCKRMFSNFGGNPDLKSRDAEHLCRSLALSGDILELSQLEVDKLIAHLEEGAIPFYAVPWFWGTRGLIAYRNGDSESAVRYLQEALQHQPRELAQAYIFAVLALAMNQLGRLDEARETLEQETQLVEKLWKVSENRSDHDMLIAQLLLREAQSQLKAESTVGTKPRFDDKSKPEFVPALIRQALLKPKLREIADAADRSQWRRSLRASLDARDSASLLLLTSGDQVQGQSADLIAWLGATLREVKEIVTSVTLLEQAQQEHPGDFWLNYELGKSHEAKGRNLESLGYARAALAIRPDSVGAQLAVANALRAAGQVKASTRMFAKLLNQTNMYSVDYVDLGVALSNKGELDEAIACFRKAIEDNPKNSSAHTLLGQSLQKKGQLDESIACLQKAIECDPRMAWPHWRLGSVLRDKGQLDDAIVACRRAIELDPTSVNAHCFLANALNDEGLIDEAIAEYRKAIELHPMYGGAHNNLSVALRGKGQVDEAIAECRKAIELDPKDALPHINLGLALKAMGQVDEAIAEYQKAIELDPKNASPHNNLGNALKAKGQVDEAIAEFRKAIELDPKNAGAHYSLGNALMGKGQVDEAIAEYRKAIELDPKNAILHNNLGVALQGKGKVDEAIAEFRKVIELDPKNASSHNILGLALKAKGQVDEAIAEFQKAIELDPKIASPHNNLGLALMDKGQVDEAIAEFQRHIELEKNWAGVYVNLGIALKAKGQVDEAIAEFRKAIELDPKLGMAHNNLSAALSEAKLLAFLKGEFQPSDNTERLGLAGVCYEKKLYHTAVGLFAAAFTADAKLADDRQTQHPYNAACNAALASAGQGEDAIQLDDADRARLRQQALDWLKAEVGYWGKLLDSDSPKHRPVILQTLRHWQKDSDLASLRDADALAKLSAEEQKAFNQLWADVAALLKRAETPAIIAKP